MPSIRKQKESSERGRADYIDTVVTYLECSDFVPPVKDFFPLLDSWLGEHLPEARKAARNGWMESVPAVAIITAAERRHTEQGDIFKAMCCRPITREHTRTLGKWIKSGDLFLPKDAKVCEVVSHRINKTGSSVAGLPQYWVASAEAMGFKAEGHMWFPLVKPTASYSFKSSRNPESVPLGCVRKLAPGGATGQYKVGHIMSNTHDGIIPTIAASLPIILRDFWSIRLGAENGRSNLILPASETGVCDFYRLRSEPLTSSGRRAALRHFVREHLRKPKPVKVHEHFRGAEEFEWFGLKCKVFPPGDLSKRVQGESPMPFTPASPS